MHRFRTLTIYALDLSREHQLIHRTVASLFVTRLELHVCMTKSTAQLGRFITSFPSLLYLDLDSWLPHRRPEILLSKYPFRTSVRSP